MQETSETWVQSLSQKDPLEESTVLQYSCLEKPHRQRSLAGYNPWGRESWTWAALGTKQQQTFHWLLPVSSNYYWEVFIYFDIIVLQFVGHLLGGSKLGLMVISSKRIYVTCSASQVCRSQSLCPYSGHWWSVPPQETLKHSKAGVTQSLVGSGAHRVLFEPSESPWRIWGLILKVILPLLPSCWGLSLALGYRISSLVGSNIL